MNVGECYTKMKTINLKDKRLTKEKLRELIRLMFKEQNDFSIKTDKGFIFYSSGILSKLENEKQYFSIDGRWIEV